MVLLVQPTHAQNLGFENGMLYWNTTYVSGGQNFNSVSTPAWSTEGANSVLFAGVSGFNAYGPWKSSINHTTLEVSSGDTVCIDYKKNGTQNGGWVFSSSILGNIKPPLLDGTFTNVCLPAVNPGKLDFTVSGHPQECSFPCFPTKVFLDNIRHYSCSDGEKNGFETDVDCGGSCTRCEDEKTCNTNSDCNSYYCSNTVCTPAPNFMYEHNFNFEQGLNTHWTFGGRQVGADITTNVSSLWSSEGNFSLRFSRNNGGIAHTSGFFVNATHRTNISVGDRVCMDLKKHSDTGGAWRIRLGTGGVFFNPHIINGIYNDTCAVSLGNGQLSVVIEGAQSSNVCATLACLGHFYIDNVTINAHLCSDGILNGYETAIDCGGFCGECLGEMPEEDLLAKYAPVLYFHPDEQFFPTSIEAMLGESDLREGILGNLIEESPVTINNLDNRNAGHYLDLQAASPGLIDIPPNPLRFSTYLKSVYAKEEIKGENKILQYWFFYPYNNFRGGHEGDWEMIQILLNQSGNPISSTYSYHYDARTYNWSEINTIGGTHPEIFIAEGGHASYKDPLSIWALAILENIPTRDNSIAYQNPNNYTLIKIASNESWAHFQGRWGQYLGNRSTYNGPNSPAIITYGDQPNRWNDPIGFAEHSRPSQISASTGSPVNLHAYDSQGRHTGLNGQGEVETEIPGTYLYVPSDNGKEVIVILSNEDIKFVVEATNAGAFNLSVNDYDRETDSQITLAFQDIQVINETIAILNVAQTNPNSILQIDEEGDGEIDITATPDEKIVQGEVTNQEEDTDNDGLADSLDNCPTLHNPNQNTDFDEDGFDNELCGGNDCNDEDAAINPSQNETCDNIDNNCNSQIDEKLFFTFGTNVGTCEFGIQTCSLGTYSITTPSIEPTIETCNAADDDCDTSTDEELNREYGNDVGECKKGTETCNNGNWDVSLTSKEPSIELCNGKDDDCNGQIDNICARNTKQYAIQFLEGAKNGVSCNKKGFCLDKALSKVIEGIQKSLDLRYYIDNETLKFNKGKDNGENVFEHEIDAVKECLRGKSFRSIHSVCEEVANLLTAADKKFAEKALTDAKRAPPINPKNQKCYDKELLKAEKFLTKADNVLSNNFPQIEILNYKKSWEHSQEAIKIVKSTKKEC